MDGAPLVAVVVAHPDDETFGCGGLLLHARAAGLRTAVVCATRGEAGEAHGDAAGAADLGAVREAELRRAAALLGVGDVELLGFLDSGMAGDPAPGTLVGAAEDDVTKAVRHSLERLRPDVVVTLDASDGHRDHERIRDATLAAARAAGVPRVLLSCLSRDLMRRWFAHMRGAEPGRAHVQDDEVLLGTPDEHLTTLLDVRPHRGDLDVAMAAHASQASPYDGLPADLRDAFLDTARARQVIPEWTGGEPERALLA